MSSVRHRNGRYYYRVTLLGKDGKRHWIERGGFDSKREAQKEADRLYPPKKWLKSTPPYVAKRIFDRFPESSSAHIPLMLMYRYNASLDEAYGLTLDQINFKTGEIIFPTRKISPEDSFMKTLLKHVDKIERLAIINGYSYSRKFPIVIDTKTGNGISKQQIYYITRVIRATINPFWHYKSFRVVSSASNDTL